MAALHPITIVGGGLAGLALGIGLRRNGIPVTIYEAGHYPRQRVCGEFISGRGQLALARLGLEPLLQSAGAVAARSVAFFSVHRSSPVRLLPTPAVCLSRWQLDARLAEEFRRVGGELQEGRKEQADILAAGVVRATGRRLEREPGAGHWFGLKIHVRNVPLVADLEMHVSPAGYVGLCRVENGEVNVCGLFRKGGGTPPLEPRELLKGTPGSILRERLAHATVAEASFCAVAGLNLAPVRAAQRPDLCLGDALTMIPPVTGNGMSMAFESAELALEPVSAWSRGTCSWEEARGNISRQCDRRFTRRLLCARWLQRVILARPLQDIVVRLAGQSSWFWRAAFGLTR